ncbi:hypothetical protein BKA62DRAFT_70389 [Auriculariales sp. MPI-PUGE-AT-0066]|nr:hypothetical protein BKA62DRAFT_70389 [Auriculariales sp. MPI-PUGE-AT-0066]
MSSPSLPSSFTISAASVTDLWRKPPAKDDYNAPSKTVRTRLGAFKRARTTLRADWTRLYDHGGFVVYGPRDATLATQRPEWWIKAGVELFPVEDGPAIASVAAAPGNFSWSDWAITPGAGLVGADGSATVELEVKDGALWFYVIKGDGKRVALREIRGGRL